MITYSIFDNTGNLVEAYDDRAESLAAFVRFISQDASDMAWFGFDAEGTMIESLVYDPTPLPTIILAAPPARPRARTLNEAKGDWNKRKRIQEAIQDELDSEYERENEDMPVGGADDHWRYLDDKHPY